MVRWAQELQDAGIRLYLLSNATGKRADFWLKRLAFAGIAWTYHAQLSYEPVGPRAFPLLCLGLMAVALAWLVLRPTPIEHDEDDPPLDARDALAARDAGDAGAASRRDDRRYRLRHRHFRRPHRT